MSHRDLAVTKALKRQKRRIELNKPVPYPNVTAYELIQQGYQYNYAQTDKNRRLVRNKLIALQNRGAQGEIDLTSSESYVRFDPSKEWYFELAMAYRAHEAPVVALLRAAISHKKAIVEEVHAFSQTLERKSNIQLNQSLWYKDEIHDWYNDVFDAPCNAPSVEELFPALSYRVDHAEY